MGRIEQIQEQLVFFLQTEIFDSSVRIEADTDLFETGFDSFSLVKLLVFIERNYNLQIPEEKLTEETLKDVNGISGLIYAFQEG